MSEEKVLYNSAPTMFSNRPFLFIICATVPIVGWIALIVWRIRVLNRILTITNERLRLNIGILAKRNIELLLSDIRCVQIDQDFIQRFFGTGNVEISSGLANKAEIQIDEIPQVNKVKEIIDEYRRQHPRQENNKEACIFIEG